MAEVAANSVDARRRRARYEAARLIPTDTVESYYSIFKRGMKGVQQRCSGKHLHRHLAEFDFRHSHRAKLCLSDAMRSDKTMGVVGKR
jgi:ISXO2-like transposase domain